MKRHFNRQAAISHKMQERTSNTRGRFIFQWIGYLILFTALLAPAIPAGAADITVATSVDGDHEAYQSTSAGLVFVSDTVGYAFYLVEADDLYYKKTTDGGASWGTGVAILTGSELHSWGVWYDRWTPGDSSWTKIHIGYGIRDDKAYYKYLDTSDDSLGSEATVSAALGNWAVGGSNRNGAISITKATDGDLFVYVSGTSAHDVYKSSNGTSWASTSASFPQRV